MGRGGHAQGCNDRPCHGACHDAAENGRGNPAFEIGRGGEEHDDEQERQDQVTPV